MNWQDWVRIGVLITFPPMAGMLLGVIIASWLELRDLKKGTSWMLQQHDIRR